jgi:hypothetical protein
VFNNSEIRLNHMTGVTAGAQAVGQNLSNLTATGFVAQALASGNLKELARLQAVAPRDLTAKDIFWLISTAKTVDILRILRGTLESPNSGELQKKFCWDMLQFVYANRERPISITQYGQLLFSVGHLDTLSPTEARPFQLKHGGTTPEFIFLLVNKSDTVEELLGVLLAIFFEPIES